MRIQSAQPSAQSASLTEEPAVRRTTSLLSLLVGPPARRDFAVRLWNGSVIPASPRQEPRFTLVLRHSGALRRMFWPPSELAIGEAFLHDDFDVEGDMEAATGLVDAIVARLQSPSALARVLVGLAALPDNVRVPQAGMRRGVPQLAGRIHSRGRDAAAVRAHYDLGNDFYALWLDSRMVYSCAYFAEPDWDLAIAQEAKLEHICRKLRLQPGERLLDIGCGWGGLVLYAAQRYGVRALGITLSRPQAEFARERIAAAGLEDRCRIEVRDYRDLPPTSLYDKVVSVGMFEHVGRAHLPTYFAAAHRYLRPGGLFLNHGIVEVAPPAHAGVPARLLHRLWRPGAFVQRYVFPDGELVPPAVAIGYAEDAGFETRDVESLREHYALTLRQWVRRLEARHAEAADLVGEETYRVWRLYMAASARGFTRGDIGLIQALFSKPHPDGRSEIPATRADLYAAPLPVGAAAYSGAGSTRVNEILS